MVRKNRLTDMLRNEAQKALEPPSVALEALSDAPKTKAMESTVTIDTIAQTVLAPSLEAAPESSTEIAAAADPFQAAESSAVSYLAPPIALPETVAAETQDKAQQQAQALQQTIASLQAELQAQQTLVAQLQSKLEQTQQVYVELEKAKQVILQLSAANAKIPEPVAAPPAKPPAPSPPPPAKPVAPPKPPAEPRRSLQISPYPHRSDEIKPVFIPKMSSESDTRLSDADIGWVD